MAGLNFLKDDKARSTTFCAEFVLNECCNIALSGPDGQGQGESLKPLVLLGSSGLERSR